MRLSALVFFLPVHAALHAAFEDRLDACPGPCSTALCATTCTPVPCLRALVMGSFCEAAGWFASGARVSTCHELGTSPETARQATPRAQSSLRRAPHPEPTRARAGRRTARSTTRRCSTWCAGRGSSCPCAGTPSRASTRPTSPSAPAPPWPTCSTCERPPQNLGKP